LIKFEALVTVAFLANPLPARWKASSVSHLNADFIELGDDDRLRAVLQETCDMTRIAALQPLAPA
jgi:hypothetical protein